VALLLSSGLRVSGWREWRDGCGRRSRGAVRPCGIIGVVHRCYPITPPRS